LVNTWDHVGYPANPNFVQEKAYQEWHCGRIIARPKRGLYEPTSLDHATQAFDGGGIDKSIMRFLFFRSAWFFPGTSHLLLYKIKYTMNSLKPFFVFDESNRVLGDPHIFCAQLEKGS
jgi:hypothetical protein